MVRVCGRVNPKILIAMVSSTCTALDMIELGVNHCSRHVSALFSNYCSARTTEVSVSVFGDRQLELLLL